MPDEQRVNKYDTAIEIRLLICSGKLKHYEIEKGGVRVHFYADNDAEAQKLLKLINE